jgi:hypothetical protein
MDHRQRQKAFVHASWRLLLDRHEQAVDRIIIILLLSVFYSAFLPPFLEVFWLFFLEAQYLVGSLLRAADELRFRSRLVMNSPSNHFSKII